MILFGIVGALLIVGTFVACVKFCKIKKEEPPEVRKIHVVEKKKAGDDEEQKDVTFKPSTDKPKDRN